ncbi:hypothetical protein NBM05_11350 [Rothia sp. AR01]|uniref:Uncharacterized protein n=1 Tax=Rothia santali TaxID=2949643 RepID=A0A9X2KIZ4_9MICC|nr:hypothetical protein [Rothia santali]MCP3426580.1 hypothetical protein [Rothia santali]
MITGSPVLLQGTDRVVFDRGDAPPVTGTHHELLAGDDDYRRKVLG